MVQPGHYISLARSATQFDFLTPLSKSGVVGVQRRYVWRDLQRGYKYYSFGQIRSDIALAHSLGGKLVIFLEDKTFTDERILPDYLSHHEWSNTPGGYTAARWQPEIIEAKANLIDAIYQKVGNHPGFGGLAIQESAPGLDAQSLTESGYTPEAYIEALSNIRCDYLYLNFIPENQNGLTDVILATDAIVGGPDLLPDSATLTDIVYPHFMAAPNIIPQFTSVQFDSYEHPKDGSSPDFWTMQELIDWAVDNLRVQTIFWNDKTWTTPAGSYNVDDAYIAIANNPVL